MPSQLGPVVEPSVVESSVVEPSESVAVRPVVPVVVPVIVSVVVPVIVPSVAESVAVAVSLSEVALVPEVDDDPALSELPLSEPVADSESVALTDVFAEVPVAARVVADSLPDSELAPVSSPHPKGTTAAKIARRVHTPIFPTEVRFIIP